MLPLGRGSFLIQQNADQGAVKPRSGAHGPAGRSAQRIIFLPRVSLYNYWTTPMRELVAHGSGEHALHVVYCTAGVVIYAHKILAML